MKLVELLARELSEWPECVSITQDYDGDVGLYSISNPTTCDAERAVWRFGGHIRNIAHLSRVASDHATAIVTRTDWSAERARIAKPAKKADKDGWIRHRGGKQPLPDDVLTQVILRKESKKQFDDKPFIASDWEWSHCNCGDDVMYYREYKPVEQVDSSPRKCEGRGCSIPDSGEHSQECLLDAALEQGWAGPCEWRDRITEIDATTQALTTERADLVQKLASEGFALIGRVVELVEDMSDWRNWKDGDMVEMVKAKTWADMTDGKLYKITGKTDGEFSFIDDVGDVRTSPDTRGGEYAKDFKWHSRPSA